MAMKALIGLPILAACALVVGGAVAANASPYLVTIEQMGPDVVATGSGNIDLTGLTLSSLHSTFSAGVNPPEAVVTLSSGVADTYSGTLSGPPGGVLGPGFGPGIGIPHPLFEPATSSTGNLVSFSFTFSSIHVFQGYMSDGALGTSTDTWDAATFTSLGLTSGTYEWTWGPGADQNFTIEIGTPVATPLPAALPLFASGLGALGLFGWRRKRKSSVPVSA
jgi:hypothetical protein